MLQPSYSGLLKIIRKQNKLPKVQGKRSFGPQPKPFLSYLGVFQLFQTLQTWKTKTASSLKIKRRCICKPPLPLVKGRRCEWRLPAVFQVNEGFSPYLPLDLVGASAGLFCAAVLEIQSSFFMWLNCICNYNGLAEH